MAAVSFRFDIVLCASVATAAVVVATGAITMTSPVVKYGCFNTMLEMACVNRHVLVFESARYGRNNTMVRTIVF